MPANKEDVMSELFFKKGTGNTYYTAFIIGKRIREGL
jgi:hypothetical protein